MHLLLSIDFKQKFEIFVLFDCSLMILEKRKQSLTCLLLGFREIRRSRSAVWCRKWGSSTLILLKSPNQIWGGGFQKPFLTWRHRHEEKSYREGERAKGKSAQKEGMKLQFFLQHIELIYTNKEASEPMTPSCLRQLNGCAN